MNKVSHFELPVDDVNRAKEFYQVAFGWKIQPMPEMNYNFIHTAKTDDHGMIQEIGAINGGMYKRSDGGSKSPVIVIEVDSIDDSLSKIKELGNEIVFDKREVGDMGYYAQVKDTEGNTLGVWQSKKKK